MLTSVLNQHLNNDTCHRRDAIVLSSIASGTYHLQFPLNGISGERLSLMVRWRGSNWLKVSQASAQLCCTQCGTCERWTPQTISARWLELDGGESASFRVHEWELGEPLAQVALRQANGHTLVAIVVVFVEKQPRLLFDAFSSRLYAWTVTIDCLAVVGKQSADPLSQYNAGRAYDIVSPSVTARNEG